LLFYRSYELRIALLQVIS